MVPFQKTSWSKSQADSQEVMSGVEEMNICDVEGVGQVSVIIPEGETVKGTAQRIVWDNLSEKEVKMIAKALTVTPPNPVATSSRLSSSKKSYGNLMPQKK